MILLLLLSFKLFVKIKNKNSSRYYLKTVYKSYKNQINKQIIIITVGGGNDYLFLTLTLFYH